MKSYITQPNIPILPYTGFYFFRRIQESSITGSSGPNYGSHEAWYQGISYPKNRIRGNYPSGGRMGMMIVLERVRTGRYFPFATYAWPPMNESKSLWPEPQKYFRYKSSLTSVHVWSTEQDINYGVGGMLVGAGEVEAANDLTPPSGFSSDLTGILVYVYAVETPLTEIKKSIDPKIGILSVYEGKKSLDAPGHKRYEIGPVRLNPILRPGVALSAGQVLGNTTPSGLYWDPTMTQAISPTFDHSRILPDVETWRDLNLFPIAYDDLTSSTYAIADFPIDYSNALAIYGQQIPEESSVLYKFEPLNQAKVVKTFDGFVYWVTREGPVDLLEEPVEKIRNGKKINSIHFDRRVYNFIFEVSIALSGSTGLEDNPQSRYRSTISNLFATNAIAPFSIPGKTHINFPLVPVGGPYNSNAWSSKGLNYCTPASTISFQSAVSKCEAAWNYDLKDSPIFSGNIILDKDLFRRMKISGYVHTHLFAGISSIFEASMSTPFYGYAPTLIGVMTAIGTPGYSSFLSDGISSYLGSLTHSLMYNYTMPEIGVTLGSHRGRHRIHLMTCGYSDDKEPPDPDNPPNPEEPPKPTNRLVDDLGPIYEYNGFAASPHRVTFTDNGMVLIPTDIGILQFNLLTNKVMCEWLNPVLIPYISDLAVISTPPWDGIVSPIPKELKITPNGNRQVLLLDISINLLADSSGQAYNPGVKTVLKVKAEDVYSRTSHIGSYGQVIYEQGDFRNDLIILLDRTI